MFKTLSNGQRISFTEYNKDRSKSILFLHGNSEDSHTYDSLIDSLSDYHLILMDSRGHGESAKGKLSYKLMAEDAYLLLNELKIDEINVVGYSDGGIIALYLSLIDETLVKKMFLLGVNYDTNGLKDDSIDEIKRGYKETKSEYLKLMLKEPHLKVDDLKAIDSRAIIITSDSDCIKMDHSMSLKENIKNTSFYNLGDTRHEDLVDNEKTLDIIKYEMSLDIYYEDNHVIVVDKPCGVLSQEDKYNTDDLLNQVKLYLKFKYNKPGNVYLALISRLDRNVSGLMVFSKSTKATERLNCERPVKTYQALVYGKFEKKSGTITLKLSKDEDKRIAYIDEKSGKNSVTHYEVVEEIGDYSLVDVTIDTGRFHQIRFSMSYVGHPIFGDYKYNKGVEYSGSEIALDAYRVKFIHPVTKDDIIIEREKDLRKMIRK